MATTNVPRLTFGSRGFVAPTESEILAGRQADIQVAFGGGVNPALSTPQGQLAMSDSAIIGSIYDLFVYMTNQFDPNYAEGRWQDGLAAIYFITRKPALPTVVTAICSGLEGVVIPLGALAQATDGNVYVCTSAGTIGGDGNATCQFSCTVPGAIACPSGSLNQIYQAIPGWDSINNPDAGVIGQDVEQRAAFEERRFRSVAKNSLGALPSILGSILEVPNLVDAYVTENPTGSPVDAGGVTLPGHTLYVAAVGGTDDAVANAIWTKKAPGCDTYGNTEVTVYDKNYNAPYPEYSVKFERPTPLPIIFKVTLANNAGVPSDVEAQVRNAIISAFAGGDGGSRARIGDTIFASRFYAPIAALGPWVRIVSIKIGCENVPAAEFTAAIAATTLTVSAVASGTIAIGQTVVDEAGEILPGTKITAGASLSWTVGRSQAVGSRTMFGVVADQDDVTAQVDQSPNCSADNIEVVLT